MIKIIFTVILSLVIAWMINIDLIFSPDQHTVASPADTPLQKTINQCAAIADNSVAHLQEVVEFQRLEKIGRKARVMRLCMHDHHYQQHSQWTKYAKAEAIIQAKQNRISTDEAFESLRRAHMVLITPPPHVPHYWILMQSVSIPKSTAKKD